MIRSWEGVASDGGTVNERSIEEESPLPQPSVAGEKREERALPVSEGPLLSALLNKMETLLDQVCVVLIIQWLFGNCPISLLVGSLMKPISY